MLRTLGKPLRTVLWWQLCATAVAVLAGQVAAGVHGALSAMLGGLAAVLPGLVSGILATRGKGESAGGVILAALTAEAVKIGLIVLLLWLVLATYEAVVVLAFIGSFLANALTFSLAFFVRDQ